MDRSFGAYQLGEPLAALPFGELVAATHPARSEPLALLLLDAGLSGDHRFRGLVRLEMARAGGLRQPGVARMIEISEQSGALAVVYERPAGAVSLTTQRASGTSPGASETHSVIRRLAEALDVAHGRRIAHGLLGPDSVLIGADGAAALVGIGLLAAVEEAGLREHILERADEAGLAPEQQSGKLAVASADGYALAVLAEQALGDDAARARSALDRQLLADPSQRFRNCLAFATALTEASTGDSASGSGSPAAPASTASPSTTPPAYVAPPPTTPPAAHQPPSGYADRPPTVTPPPPPPPPPSSLTTAPLPWNAPPSASSALPTSPPAYAQPPASRPEPVSPPAAPPSSGSNLPSWLRDSLDPPNALAQRGPAIPQSAPNATRPDQPAPTSHGPPPADERLRWRSERSKPPTVTRRPATPAMLAFQKTQSQADLGTMLVLAITNRIPALDRLADRYAPDGKIGPVPLGLVVAGALAAILLLLRQPVPAAILGVLVLGLYVMPKVLGKIVAAEQPHPEAVRVTGTVSLRKRMVGMNWDVFELDIEDGAPLSLPPSAYRRLAGLGTPVTVERPTMYGPEQVTYAHELYDVTVTYLMPGRLLLDVRDPGGVVIHRHPEYAGEPGDRASLAAPSAGLGPNPERGATAFERPDRTPTWKTTPYGHRIVLPMPPALAGELETAFKSTAVTAGLLNGIPVLILVASAIFGDFGFFALIVAGVIFVMIGGGQLMRALALHRARQAESIIQVSARMSLRHVERTGSKGSKSQHYFMRLDDGAELKIEKPLFEKLARLGRQLEMGERPGIWERLTQSEETVHAYDLQGPTVSYEPSSQLLLEVMDAGGNTLYRDSAITPRSIGNPPPKQP